MSSPSATFFLGATDAPELSGFSPPLPPLRLADGLAVSQHSDVVLIDQVRTNIKEVLRRRHPKRGAYTWLAKEMRIQRGYLTQLLTTDAEVEAARLTNPERPKRVQRKLSLTHIEKAAVALGVDTSVLTATPASDAPDTESVQGDETAHPPPPSDVVVSGHLAPQSTTTQSSGRIPEEQGLMPLVNLGARVLHRIGDDLLIELASLRADQKLWLAEQIAALKKEARLPLAPPPHRDKKK